MKKLATLIAGVMLVGGTIFAGDLSVNGKVEHELLSINTNNETIGLTNGGDQYFQLNITKELNETTKLTLGYDTDDANPDMVGALKLTKQVNDNIEAQVAVDVDTTTGMKFSESDGGDTYIKFMPSDVLTLTFKPFEAGTGVGDELATTGTQDAGGVEVSFGAEDAPLTVNGAVNFDNSYINKDGDNYNAIGLKAGGTFTGVENLSVTGELSMNTQVDDGKSVVTGYEIVDTPKAVDENGVIIPASSSVEPIITSGAGAGTKMAINARASYTMGDLTLKGEFLNVTLNKGVYADESGTGIFAKAEYNLGEIASGVTASVNGSFKNYSKYLYFDDDTYGNFDSADYKTHGGANIIGAGVDFNWNGLSISNDLELISAENKVFMDKTGDTPKATDRKSVV